MSLGRISHYNLYFYGPLAISALRDRSQHLDPYLNKSLGQSWFQDLAEEVDTYRWEVEKWIGERTESRMALRDLDEAMNKVALWRTTCTNIARQAPPEKRRLLMQATGFGLGSPRTVKEMMPFLLEVKERMALHQDELRALGANEKMLQFPADILAILEKESSSVAREKAEDSAVRHNLKQLRSGLAQRLDCVASAAAAASGQALLFDEPNSEELVGIEIALEKALGEAKVNARKIAKTTALPVELVGTPTADVVLFTDGEGPVTRDPAAEFPG